MKTIKERILEIAKKEERFKRDFFKKTGLNYSNFTGFNKTTDISANALKTIVQCYPKVDLYWLVCGSVKENAPKTPH
jgi:hypothetical protein